MPKIKIDKARCKACYLCIVNCPNGLIRVTSDINIKGVKAAQFSGDRCTGCGLCAVICPDGCIKVYR